MLYIGKTFLKDHFKMLNVDQCIYSPTSIKDTPVIVLLKRHLRVALREEFLRQDCTPFPSPCHSVGVQLNKTELL